MCVHLHTYKTYLDRLYKSNVRGWKLYSLEKGVEESEVLKHILTFALKLFNLLKYTKQNSYKIYKVKVMIL